MSFLRKKATLAPKVAELVSNAVKIKELKAEPWIKKLEVEEKVQVLQANYRGLPVLSDAERKDAETKDAETKEEFTVDLWAYNIKLLWLKLQVIKLEAIRISKLEEAAGKKNSDRAGTFNDLEQQFSDWKIHDSLTITELTTLFTKKETQKFSFFDAVGQIQLTLNGIIFDLYQQSQQDFDAKQPKIKIKKDSKPRSKKTFIVNHEADIRNAIVLFSNWMAHVRGTDYKEHMKKYNEKLAADVAAELSRLSSRRSAGSRSSPALSDKDRDSSSSPSPKDPVSDSDRSSPSILKKSSDDEAELKSSESEKKSHRHSGSDCSSSPDIDDQEKQLEDALVKEQEDQARVADLEKKHEEYTGKLQFQIQQLEKYAEEAKQTLAQKEQVIAEQEEALVINGGLLDAAKAALPKFADEKEKLEETIRILNEKDEKQTAALVTAQAEATQAQQRANQAAEEANALREQNQKLQDELATAKALLAPKVEAPESKAAEVKTTSPASDSRLKAQALAFRQHPIELLHLLNALCPVGNYTDITREGIKAALKNERNNWIDKATARTIVQCYLALLPKRGWLGTRLSIFSKVDKDHAANKVLDLLDGKTVKFIAFDLNALMDGLLGNIIKIINPPELKALKDILQNKSVSITYNKPVPVSPIPRAG